MLVFSWDLVNTFQAFYQGFTSGSLINMNNHLFMVIISALLISCSSQLTREEIIKNSLKAKRLPGLGVCGLSGSSFESKIINGKPAELGAYPWMANIGFVEDGRTRVEWLCAGSLISDQYIITAAHCIHPSVIRAKRRLTPKMIRLGELDLDPNVNDGANPMDYEIENFVYHEQYDNSGKVNDIGLIKLKNKLPNYTAHIRPICLPPPEFQTELFVGYSPIVAGWGKSVNTNVKAGTRLLEAEVEIKDTESCKRNITSVIPRAAIDNRVVCASSPGKDSCQGDSGGPLMFYRRIKKNANNNMFLMGIVSYGYSCAVDGYPGVYTRVSQYMGWIIDKMDI